jgi:hypothetical protein
MDEIHLQLIKRLINRYDAIIAELEVINETNRAFVPVANQNPNDPVIIAWAAFARENLAKLQAARVDLESLMKKCL